MYSYYLIISQVSVYERDSREWPSISHYSTCQMWIWRKCTDVTGTEIGSTCQRTARKLIRITTDVPRASTELSISGANPWNHILLRPCKICQVRVPAHCSNASLGCSSDRISPGVLFFKSIVRRPTTICGGSDRGNTVYICADSCQRFKTSFNVLVQC